MRVLIRPVLVLAAALGLAACATVVPPPTGPTREVYSDVEFSDETGDAGGYELELTREAAGPRVVFAICEGGCRGGDGYEARLEGEVLSFFVVEQWTTLDASPAEQEIRQFQVRLSGDHAVLTSPDYPELNARLERLRDPEPGRTRAMTEYN